MQISKALLIKVRFSPPLLYPIHPQKGRVGLVDYNAQLTVKTHVHANLFNQEKWEKRFDFYAENALTDRQESFFMG